MSVKIDSIVNTLTKVPFVSTGNTTGLVSFSNVWLLKDGVNAGLAITYTEIGNGLYVASFTPTSTGFYALFIETRLQGFVHVVAKSAYLFLQNLEDTAIGSWTWDKNTNILLIKRQDGTTLAGFSVQDDLTDASRQRTTP
jgi:hypothetical protein